MQRKLTRVGLGVPKGMLPPPPPLLPLPLMPRQACLYGPDVPCDSPCEVHLPWDFALHMPGSAGNSLFYFILQGKLAEADRGETLNLA